MATGANINSRRGGDKSYDTGNLRGMREDKGIVIGIVKSNSHPARIGNLMVFIETYGNQGESVVGEKKKLEDDPTQWRLVRYCTPFFSRAGGSQGIDTTELDVKNTGGMIYPCPDIGTKVLCFFPSGKTADGFWFACVPDTYMMQSLPEASMSSNIGEDGKDLVRYSKAAALDFNDKREEHNVRKIKSFLAPKRAIAKSVQRNLKEQGLDQDEIRGLTTSNYMRETPSELFGISTKGRRIDKNGKDISERTDILNSLKTGSGTEREIPDSLDTLVKPLARKQGHVFVMDDGDLEGNNNLVRIRTANGHQLLLHDTEDLVYISNAKGTAWVQFDGTGQVDLYSEVNVNIRSKNINFHADDSIRMHAGKTMQLVAGNNMHVEGGTLLNMYTEKGKAFTYGGAGVEVKGEGNVNIQATAEMNLKSGGTLNAKASLIALQGPAADAQKQNAAPVVSYPDTQKDGSGFYSASTTVRSSTDRVPTHEPFPGHAVTTQPTIYQSATSTLSTDNTPVFPANPPKVKDNGVNNILNDVNTEGVLPVSIARQPASTVAMGSLGSEAVRSVAAGIVENLGTDFDYNAVDAATGAVGKYAATVEVLQQGGYIRPEAVFNGQLSNPSLWLGKNSVNSLDDFLANTFEQESLFTNTLFSRYQTMVSRGIVKEIDSPEVVGGLLSTAYTFGVDQTKNLREGISLQPLPISGTDMVLSGDTLTTNAKKFFKKGISAVKSAVTV